MSEVRKKAEDGVARADAAQTRADAAQTRANNAHDRADAARDRAEEAWNRAGHGHPDQTSVELRGTPDEHRHSISSTTFIQKSKAERMRMLQDRAALEALLESGALGSDEEIQARNTLNLLSLLMDYRDYDAYERERRFSDPEWAEWTEDYKRTYGVDEYAEQATKQFQSHSGVQMNPFSGIAHEGGG